MPPPPLSTPGPYNHPSFLSLTLFSLRQEERVSMTLGFGQLTYSKEQSTDRVFLGSHLFETEDRDTKMQSKLYEPKL